MPEFWHYKLRTPRGLNLMDPVAALKAKQVKILADAQAQSDEISRDIADLERMRAIAEKYGFKFADIEAKSITPSPKPVVSPKKARDENTASKLSQKNAEELIRGRGAPVALPEIKEYLEMMDIEIGGLRPSATLSAYLTSNPALASIRKGWWGLREWKTTRESKGDAA